MLVLINFMKAMVTNRVVSGNFKPAANCVIRHCSDSSTPPENQATGGLYESSRTDRSPYPSPFATITKEQSPSAENERLPEGAYPVHDDPSSQTSNPHEASKSPAEASTAPGGPIDGSAKNERPAGLAPAAPAFAGKGEQLAESYNKIRDGASSSK